MQVRKGGANTDGKGDAKGRGVQLPVVKSRLQGKKGEKTKGNK